MNKSRHEKSLHSLKVCLGKPLWRTTHAAINFDVSDQKYRRCIMQLDGHPEPIPKESNNAALEFIAEEIRAFHRKLGVKPLQEMSQDEFDLSKVGDLAA